MYKTATMMMMVCESPLHAGTGSDLDFIDNPIQRERHTGYPKIESSSIKGALRERFSAPNRTEMELAIAFGPDNPKPGEERQGSLGFTDARLLLFPVKSMKGVFAWVTCPSVLQRFQVDMQRLRAQADFEIHNLPQVPSDQVVLFSDDLVIKNQAGNRNVVLEEYAFTCNAPATDICVGTAEIPLNDWLANHIFPVSAQDLRLAYWNHLLRNNLLIISDTDFADFAELTTEVITRNKIDPNTGTVASGHLFTEEYLPADSVLYSLVMAHPEFTFKGEKQGLSADEILGYFKDQLSIVHDNSFQAGGNATIGKGLLRTVLF